MVIIVRTFIYYQLLRCNMGKLIEGENGYEYVYTSEEYHDKVQQLLNEKLDLIQDKYDYATERVAAQLKDNNLVWVGLSLTMFLMGICFGVAAMA